jgi:hypothetical protein
MENLKFIILIFLLENRHMLQLPVNRDNQLALLKNVESFLKFLLPLTMPIDPIFSIDYFNFHQNFFNYLIFLVTLFINQILLTLKFQYHNL